MTYAHLTGWNMPALSDGDVIRDSNLYGAILPDINITIINSNLMDVDIPENVKVVDCLVGKSEPIEPQTEFDSIKEQAKNKLLEVKPLAYENPLAVKVALGEAFTPEEFQGVMEAN